MTGARPEAAFHTDGPPIIVSPAVCRRSSAYAALPGLASNGSAATVVVGNSRARTWLGARNRLSALATWRLTIFRRARRSGFGWRGEPGHRPLQRRRSTCCCRGGHRWFPIHLRAVLPDGTYNVPNSMPYGTYSAIPGPKGSCAFYIYDNTGKLIDLRQLHQRI